MIGIVVAAHSGLAEALVKTAHIVAPETKGVVAVGIDIEDDSSGYEQRLRDAIESVKDDGGVIVLTDMFGGTPSNVGLTFHEPGAVEVLTGANLPMLMKAIQLSERGMELERAAVMIKEAGQRAIVHATEILGDGQGPRRTAS